MIRFEMREHSVISGRQVIEVFEDETFIASITAADVVGGIRINSKYFARGLRAGFLSRLSGFLGVHGFGIVTVAAQLELHIVPPEFHGKLTPESDT